MKTLYNSLDNALVDKINDANTVLDVVKERLRESKNNFSLKNENFLENIEKGYLPFALVGMNLLGLDINYAGKEHGKNALMLSLAGNNSLLLKIILEDQSDFTKPRLSFLKVDNDGNDALIHAVKSGNYDNCLFILAYPELLFQTISNRYFSGFNKELLTPEVEQKIREAIKNSYVIDMRHTNKEGMSALAYAIQSPNEKLFQLINAVSKVDEWKMTNQEITKIDSSNGSFGKILKRFAKIVADRIAKNVINNSEYWEKKIENIGHDSQVVLGLYRIHRDRDEIFLKSFRNDTIEKNFMAGLADINYSSKTDGKTAMIIGAESKSRERLDWIILNSLLQSKELDTKKQDLNGNTALMCAVENENLDAVKKIIRYKAEYLKRIRTKFSTINGVYDLLAKQDFKIEQSDFGYLLNMTNNNGKSALMIAAKNGNYRAMDVIMKNANKLGVGLDFTRIDNSGENILTLAVKKGKLEVVDLIFKNCQYNYLVDLSNGNGKTPIEIAIEKNDVKMVDLLIKNKASVKVLTKEGKNLFDVAIFNCCFMRIRKLLKSEGLAPTQKNNSQKSYGEYSSNSLSKEREQDYFTLYQYN